MKPATPADLTVTDSTADTVDLAWTDKFYNESGFFIHRKLEGAAGYTSVGNVGPNITDYQDSGLTPGTKYQYVVTAYNSVGSSLFSNEASVTTPLILIGKPLAPTLLTAFADPNDACIDITWKNNSSNEAGFYIYRKQDGAAAFSKIHDSGSGGWTGYGDMDLLPGTKYYYYVSAYNFFGSANSNILSATTTGTPPAVKPQVPIIQPIKPPKGDTTILRFYINELKYFINDIATPIDVAPIIKDSRTLLPIRYVATPLGAEVECDPNTRKVTISNNKTRIEMWIGTNTALVNGVEKMIDPNNSQVTPIIVPPGRTMLPLRFISENLGCLVDWRGDLREAKITYPQP